MKQEQIIADLAALPLKLLDARRTVEAEALVCEWSTYHPDQLLPPHLIDLAQRITAYANQQALKAALHEADTWRAFILNDPRYAELWATFGKPEDLSADDVGVLIDEHANQRYREGVEACLDQMDLISAQWEVKGDYGIHQEYVHRIQGINEAGDVIRAALLQERESE